MVDNGAESQMIQTPRRLSDFSSPSPSDEANNAASGGGEEGRSADSRVDSTEGRRRSNLDGVITHDGIYRRAESGVGGGVTGSVVVGRGMRVNELFPDIPEGDQLVDDFSCYLHKDSTRIQGRLYLWENHVCFYANLFGWVTQLTIPIGEVIILQKSLNTGPIPNSLRFTTIAAVYNFSSFPDRNAAYDIIHETWLRATSIPVPLGTAPRETTCRCSVTGQHYYVNVLEKVFQGTPERLYDLMFVGGFSEKFMRDEGMTDVRISNWITVSPDSSQNLTVRKLSYLKPRNSLVGLEWIKYEVEERVVHSDFEDFVSVVSTAKTPNATSGKKFSIKTRTCLMWASPRSTKVIVTTRVEWSGTSFIKNVIEREAIENQQAHYTELARAMSIYIKNHQSQFVPEALDLHASSSSPPITTVADIRALIPTETAEATLLGLEVGLVPPVLDLLQAEITTKTPSEPGYRRKCGKYLRLLVDKHRVLPPSLFVKEIKMKDMNLITCGGYSDIYQGSVEKRSVCLKVLRIHVGAEEEKNLREFCKEALLWTQLTHPNLLPFLGVNTTLFPQRLCLVSPWMANGQITKFLKLNPGYDRLKVTSEIAAGISYLHSLDIVHGDIKGANVLVDERGRCYLADFGLARASMTTTLLSSTMNTIGKGTARWMAPELFSAWAMDGLGGGGSSPNPADGSDDTKPTAPGNVKTAIDIYAYGCTVYEIISGNIPFAQPINDVQVMFHVLSGRRPERPTLDSAPWCPDNIWELVELCWVKESWRRPKAGEVCAFLERLEVCRREGGLWEKERFSVPV